MIVGIDSENPSADRRIRSLRLRNDLYCVKCGVKLYSLTRIRSLKYEVQTRAVLCRRRLSQSHAAAAADEKCAARRRSYDYPTPPPTTTRRRTALVQTPLHDNAHLG